MAQFIKVASTADLAPGEAKCVEVAGKKIALFNLEGSFKMRSNTRQDPTSTRSSWSSPAVPAIRLPVGRRGAVRHSPFTTRAAAARW